MVAMHFVVPLQAQSRTRYKISESSLQEIMERIPPTNYSWLVDCVLQYRCVYGVEQWLIKWKDYTDDHNTWESWCVSRLICL